MQKYTQQESIIQNLQNANQDLIRQIQAFEESGHMERMSMMSESQGTEMGPYASEGAMSELGGRFGGKFCYLR